MFNKILTGIVLLLLIAIVFVYLRTRPSGDIDDFKKYYANDTAMPDSNHVGVTYFGATTLLFDDGQSQVLIDGFFSRPSLWKVLSTDIQSDTATIDKIIFNYDISRARGIFVAHTHYDHALDIAYVAKKTGAVIFGSESAMSIGKGGSLSSNQLTEFAPGQDYQLGEFNVKVIASKHSPGNALDDDGKEIPGKLIQPASMKAYAEGGSFDFLIRHRNQSFYVKASPNFIAGALDTIKTDAVFIGIGTVSKQDTSWQQSYYHETIDKLKPGIVVPIHWDDFFEPFSEHLVMLPKFSKASPDDFNFFIKKTKAGGIDFKVLQGGKRLLLSKQ